jgi:hypothetical protein
LLKGIVVNETSAARVDRIRDKWQRTVQFLEEQPIWQAKKSPTGHRAKKIRKKLISGKHFSEKNRLGFRQQVS